MNAILLALKEEKKQATHLLRVYLKEFKQLPQGTFFIRKRGQKSYGYITSSLRGKIRQLYLGSLDKEEIEKYQELMSRKKKLKELIRNAEKQKKFLTQSLKYARKKS